MTIHSSPYVFDFVNQRACVADTVRWGSTVDQDAGNVDILVLSDLDSGNMLVKQLIYLSGAESAGIVLGARTIVLTHRSDMCGYDSPRAHTKCY